MTGSARGIGKAIAIRLALDGYNVCINDIPANQKGCEETAAEIQSIGRKACVAIADVTKRDQVKQLVQTSVKALGPLDTMYVVGPVQSTAAFPQCRNDLLNPDHQSL